MPELEYTNTYSDTRAQLYIYTYVYATLDTYLPSVESIANF